MRLVLTPEARHDLHSIKNYISQFSPTAAAGVLKAIRSRCRRLTRFPESCAVVRQRERAAIRRAVSSSYLVFYTIVDDELRVLRVVHGARDISAVFDAQGDLHTEASD